MNLKVCSLLCLLALITIQVKSQENESIDFKTNLKFQDALKEAKLSNRLLFVDVFATWCAPCKKMDKEVFTVPAIVGYFNENYFSYKLQGDSTANDPVEYKERYAETKALLKRFKIFSYPTYLFLSGEGLIVRRVIGYQDQNQFLKEAKTAVSDLKLYNTQKEVFATGKMSEAELISLMEASKSYEDLTFSERVAAFYKANYFDKSVGEDVLNKANNNFVIKFPQLLTSKDKYFEYVVNRPKTIDSLTFNNYAKFLLEQVILREYINSKIYDSKGKLNTNKPDWIKMEDQIQSKFDSKLAKKLIVTAKERYYKMTNEMEKSISYGMQLIEINGVDSLSIGAASINNFIFNKLLKYSKNLEEFKKAKEWMEILIRNGPTHSAYHDTYAFVLYKLGDKKGAVEAEKTAIEEESKRKDSKFKDEALKEYKKNLDYFIR